MQKGCFDIEIDTFQSFLLPSVFERTKLHIELFSNYKGKSIYTLDLMYEEKSVHLCGNRTNVKTRPLHEFIKFSSFKLCGIYSNENFDRNPYL